MSRPVICQVLHSLDIGGAEVLAANLARSLQDRFHFVFACLDQPGAQSAQLEREGFEIDVIGRRAGFDWNCMRKLAACFARRRVQLIHAHQYTPFFYAAGSGLFRKRPSILFTEHGRWYPDRRSRKRVLFNRMMLRKRDRVVGVGEHVRRALIDNEGLPADRVGVIYNGVNLSNFGRRECSENCRLRTRRELKIADDAVVVLQVARLDALKDHLMAVEAAVEVAKLRSDVQVLFVGDGPERASIESAIQSHSLGHCVQLLGSRNDVGRLLMAADIFLLTSISEGIPLTIIEAMAAGLPVVATAVGGVPEVVVEETGLLVPKKSPALLANAIMRLANDPSLRRSLGHAGELRAQKLFSDDQMNNSYANAYEEMLCG
jgi:glycosyltransferase involved in cell wall biosynthesis